MVPRLQPALVAARDVPAATACAATALTASEQVFGIALVSDFFMLVTGIAGSCFYCKWERRSRSTMRCTLWLPCALCNALCTPARGIGCDSALRCARWTLSSPHASAPLPRACVDSLLPPFNPPPSIPPTSRQRGAFAAADKSAEGTIHFSNNDKKFGKKSRGRNGKGRTREIQLTNVRNAL